MTLFNKFKFEHNLRFTFFIWTPGSFESTPDSSKQQHLDPFNKESLILIKLSSYENWFQSIKLYICKTGRVQILLYASIMLIIFLNSKNYKVVRYDISYISFINVKHCPVYVFILKALNNKQYLK